MIHWKNMFFLFTDHMHKYFVFVILLCLLNVTGCFCCGFVTCARKSLLLEMNEERNNYLYVSLLQVLNFF